MRSLFSVICSVLCSARAPSYIGSSAAAISKVAMSNGHCTSVKIDLPPFYNAVEDRRLQGPLIWLHLTQGKGTVLSYLTLARLAVNIIHYENDVIGLVGTQRLLKKHFKISS